ncbi:MAG TPA: ACT domain-containing protein [Thermoanaerobaculia bacterium]|nr:ACT domain-containing protein [Thermoanaerobaculia bacterium]
MSSDKPLQLTLSRLPGRWAVCRLPPGDPLPPRLPDGFWSITRTPFELSLVIPEEVAPDGYPLETGFAAFIVAGPLDFAWTGILADLTGALAEAGISVFAVSTFDTDVLLVREDRVEEAVAAWTGRGHVVG